MSLSIAFPLSKQLESIASGLWDVAVRQAVEHFLEPPDYEDWFVAYSKAALLLYITRVANHLGAYSIAFPSIFTWEIKFDHAYTVSDDDLGDLDPTVLYNNYTADCDARGTSPLKIDDFYSVVAQRMTIANITTAAISNIAGTVVNVPIMVITIGGIPTMVPSVPSICFLPITGTSVACRPVA